MDDELRERRRMYEQMEQDGNAMQGCLVGLVLSAALWTGVLCIWWWLS